MEKSVKKSKEQAVVIKSIAILVNMLDPEYCSEIAADMMAQASRQEAMAVLNPRYPQERNEMIRLQGHALKLLCEYVETLKKVDELKQKAGKVEKQNSEIDDLFL